MSEPKPALRGIARLIVLSLGLLFFGLGAVGIVVPGMPTTIFWILASMCYLRTSPKRYEKIASHRTFGPPIRLFIEERLMTLRAKIISCSAIALFSTPAIIFVHSLAARLSIAGLGLFGITFILTVKTAPRDSLPVLPAAK